MNFLRDIYRKLLALRLWVKVLPGVILALLLWYACCLPRPLFDTPYATLVSDRQGELLGARIAPDGQWRFPAVDSVPAKYARCLTAYEDRSFYRHPGVNPLAIGRALVQNIRAGRIVSGGSTITMQTVRLMRRNNRTYAEKLIEIILATRLEWSYSKKEILALYASHAPMGGNVVGIDAASWRYFGHAASSLSWAEAATLAVLPNAPALIHFGRNRNALVAKRNGLLKYLLKEGVLNQTDYELAVDEPLPVKPHSLPQLAPHFVTNAFLQHPGTHIRSTIDKGLQIQADDVLERWSAEFSQNGIQNLAALVVDLQSNEVLAYCGNVRFAGHQSGNQVDIIRSPRSTGSILKPFLYCAMLQEGLLLPGELLPDIPVNIAGFAPKNFSLRYDGAVPANDALARSLNVPFVIALKRYGVAKFYELLKRSGFSTLNRPAAHYGLSLILGGAEGTLWDIAHTYAEMARTVTDYNRNGKYYERKDFALQYPKAQSGRTETAAPLFEAGAAWLTLQALTNVNRPEEIDWQSIPSMRRIAWKTGTSFGFRDAWAVGVTPRYLVAVWTGNASGEGRPGLTGARTSAHVMFDLFNLLPATSWFGSPYGALRKVVVCRESGCLLSKNCPESSADTIWAPLKGSQGQVCPYHQGVHLSGDGRYQVYEQCAGARGMQSASWFILPPSQAWYYRQLHTSYRDLPPFSPECRSSLSGNPMQFIYPFPGSTLRLTKQLDGSQGRVVFELAHRNSYARVFWHLDQNYIGETTDVHKMEIQASQGEHRITVVDQDGNSLEMRFFCL